MKRLLFFAGLLSVLWNSATAMNPGSLITGDTLSLSALIDRLEPKGSARYLYDREAADTIFIVVSSFEGEPAEILQRELQGTGVFINQVNPETIVFTIGTAIKLDFAEEYSSLAESRKRTVSSFDSVVYLLQEREEKETSSNAEFLLHTIGSNGSGKSSRFATVNGYIRSQKSGEPIIGAVVYSEKLEKGTVTNPYGYYSISLPRGEYTLEYRSIGYNTTRRMIKLNSDGSLNVVLREKLNPLKEVTITANREHNVQSVRIGMEKIDLATMKIIPAGMGEADVIKSAQLLPGVQTVGEAAGGFNVRGGSSDQNLVLLDDAPILNTSHFFGFFSAFNPDLVNDITLYKSSIPAKYGGRVSSVMDISLKEGNRKRFRLGGGVNPAFARVLAEGPIIKDRASFAVSARSTYSDWILQRMSEERVRKSSAGFYDLQGVLSANLNEKNSIYLSGYSSSDRFDLYQADAVRYSNTAATLKWKHTFNNRLLGVFSAVYSGYNYKLTTGEDSISLRNLEYSIKQYRFNAGFSWYPHPDHNVEAGLNMTRYFLQPGNQSPVGPVSLIDAATLPNEDGFEAAIYFSDEYIVSPKLTVSAGLRFSFYSFLGPANVLTYHEETARSLSSVSDTLVYGSGAFIDKTGVPEYRFSARYKIGQNSSFKLGVDRSVQYIHMISNNTSMSPTDIWKLSDPYLKPQDGTQFSGGYFLNLRNGSIELSLEGYYKELNNIIDYKDGAVLLMNENLETDLLNGEGKAYGAEFMLKKPRGRWTGWVAYSYSRIFHRIEGDFPGESVNSGEWFPANYDKPHDLKVISNMKFSRRVNSSLSFVYNTGRPITYPVAFYSLGNTKRVYYSDRNQYRIPDYARLDLSITFNGNMEARKLNHGSLTLAVYNILGRKNPYSVFFKTEEGRINGYQLSIYGQPVFTLTYNFKIRGNASDDF